MRKRPEVQTLAYLDKAFLDSDDARPIRILTEYLAQQLLQQSANSTLQAQLEKHLIETLNNIPEAQG